MTTRIPMTIKDNPYKRWAVYQLKSGDFAKLAAADLPAAAITTWGDDYEADIATAINTVTPTLEDYADLVVSWGPGTEHGDVDITSISHAAQATLPGRATSDVGEVTMLVSDVSKGALMPGLLYYLHVEGPAGVMEALVSCASRSDETPDEAGRLVYTCALKNVHPKGTFPVSA